MSTSRDRTTKELASRIDPTYVRRQSGSRGVVIIASICIVAAAVGWWYLARTRGAYGVVNPGHVSHAHAMWENDCAKCHDNDGKGGFRAAVSDSACLQCHDAAVHSPHQLMRNVGDNAHGNLALAVNNNGEMRSANCVVCHVEHKGEAAMAASDDAHCTNCHTNLAAAMAPGATRAVSLSVTEFNADGGHPYFGRELLAEGTSLPVPPAKFDPAILHDPTHLFFDHKRHMASDADPANGKGDNCTVCHINRNRTPFITRASATTEPSDIGSGRYMRPVSYASDCKDCHPLKVSGGALLPHVAMELVLAQVSNPADFFRNWLGRLDETKRNSLISKETPADKWVSDTVTAFGSDVSEWAGNLAKGDKKMPGAEALENVVIDIVANAPDKAGTDIRVVSAYIAFGANKGCAKCHEVKDLHLDYPAASQPASAPSGAAAPSTQPSTPLLSTVPTLIPAAPRRWFTGSTFDHQSHQNLTCVSCHSRAKESTVTADVLSPNLTWTTMSGATASCAECHHAADKTGPGAGANCVTCHVFHEKGKSTAPTARQDLPNVLPGHQTVPATQPVASSQN